MKDILYLCKLSFLSAGLLAMIPGAVIAADGVSNILTPAAIQLELRQKRAAISQHADRRALLGRYLQTE